jgi:hypothetical protein
MWPLIILAASAAVKRINEQDALRRKQKLANAMADYQRSKSAESMGATEELIKKQTPEARATELADLTLDREKSLRDTVGAAQASDAQAAAGKQSSDFSAAQEREANTRSQRLKRAIEQLAITGAPGEQALKSSQRFGRAAGVVDAANRASDYVGRNYLTDIDNTVPNPGWQLLGDVGMAVGGGMLGAGAGVGAEAGSAAAMGADSAGHFTYEDSAGNTQRSSIPYQRQQKLKRGFSLWGTR